MLDAVWVVLSIFGRGMILSDEVRASHFSQEKVVPENVLCWN
jgi:hypothetical protein